MARGNEGGGGGRLKRASGEPTSDAPRASASMFLPPPPISPQIRLSGGRSRFEGRVEVALAAGNNGTRQWGLICGDGWGTLEAMVACRQLGLGFANHGLQVGISVGQLARLLLFLALTAGCGLLTTWLVAESN